MATKAKSSILPTLVGAAASYMARRYGRTKPRSTLRFRSRRGRSISTRFKKRRGVSRTTRKRKFVYDASTAHRELTKVNVRTGRKQR